MTDPTSELRDAMRAAGIETDDEIIADGTLHRVHVDGDARGDRNGWYVLFGDATPAARYGCWKRNVDETWCAHRESDLSPADREACRQAIDSAKRQREAENKRVRSAARERAQKLWDQAQPESGDHRYLRDKGIGAHGIRTDGQCLVFPMRGAERVIQSLQFIDPNGTKRYLTGGRVTGCYHAIGTPNGIVYIAEGYATGATIHEATGEAVAVAFTANNIKPVAEALHSKHPSLRLVIAADNDRWTDGNPGVTKAREAAQAVGAELVIPEFADLSTKPTDYNDLMRLEGMEAVRRALGHPESTFGTFGTPAGEGDEKVFSTPQPLPADIPAVEAFEPLLLPETFRPWCEDIAERIQCPLDFPAIAAMIALSTVVGRQCGIRSKRHDTWLEVPNRWGAVVGRPGVLKTPAIQEGIRPLKRLEAEAREAHKTAQADWEAGQIIATERKKVTADRIRKALKAGDRDARAIAEAAQEAETEAPTRQRLIVNDSTVEKLGVILNENPRGVLVFRDELTGWLRMLERDGHENDRDFYKEAWNGTDPYSYDRIVRGTLDIEAACVSILGSIQPGPLSHYMATQGRAGDDGLMQRFQLLVWPDISGEWRDIDRWPDTYHKNRAYYVFTRLNAIDPDAIGAQRDDDSVIPFLRFSPEAQELFIQWRSNLERRLRAGNEPPAIEAHLAKYRGLVPSLALVTHLADVGEGPVSLDALERACAWGEFLESHARRVYSPAIAPDMVSARALARRLQAGDLPEKFNLRDVYRAHWSGLADKESAQKAVTVLQDFDWLVASDEATGGRPRTWYRIVPGIREIAL